MRALHETTAVETRAGDGTAFPVSTRSLSAIQKAFRDRTVATAAKWTQISADEIVLLGSLFFQDPITSFIRRTQSKLHLPKLRGTVACRLTETGYRRMRFLGKTVAAHRVAWSLHHHEWPDLAIDHINGNRADNRIENLRLGSIAENCVNRAAKPHSSRFKGVSFQASRNKWRAYIGKGPGVSARRWLGEFDTEEQAAAAYRGACIEMYGEFARFE